MIPDNSAERHSARPQTHLDSAEIVSKIDALLDGNETQHSPEWAMPLGYPNEPRRAPHFPRAHHQMWNDEVADSELARVMRSALHRIPHLTDDQRTWAHDRSLDLARITARTFEHWVPQLLRIADREDREQITDAVVVTFSTVDAVLQVIDYCDPGAFERLKRPSFNRAIEQLTIALHAFGRLLWARFERLCIPPARWLNCQLTRFRRTAQ